MNVMLTTIDNPYNPFTHFDGWNAFDTQKGYNSSAFLARIARTSPDLSVQENQNEIENAIDWILEHDVTGMYSRIYEKDTPGGSAKYTPPM